MTKRILIRCGSIALACAAILSTPAYAEEDRPPDNDRPPAERPNDERPRPNGQPVTVTQDASPTITQNGGAVDVNASPRVSTSHHQQFSYLDAIDLAPLPTANCQGESAGFSAGANDGLVGGVLGFNVSDVSEQCELINGINTVATLAKYYPELKPYVMQAVANLHGFQFLWPEDQHIDCRRWLLKGSEEAVEHDCRWPTIPGGRLDRMSKSTLPRILFPLATNNFRHFLILRF